VAEADITDVDLLTRLADGDEEAFVSLYRRWQAPIRRFALAMIGSPQTAEDVMQETFMVLIRDGGHYDPRRGPFGAYVRGVARHLVLRRIRRDSRFVALADGLADSLESLLGRDAPRSFDAGSRDMMARVESTSRIVAHLSFLTVEASHDDS
jgi:RNA polymerase sigma-70 factor (ECF subfamily)